MWHSTGNFDVVHGVARLCVVYDLRCQAQPAVSDVASSFMVAMLEAMADVPNVVV